MQKLCASIEQARRTIRTLIVDDCADLAEKLHEFLKTIPEIETVGFAADGEEAINLSARLGPELVIMDIQMPVLNGIEAAREIRMQTPETRVVLMSAYLPDGAFQFPDLADTEFIHKARVCGALPGLIEKLFGKRI